MANINAEIRKDKIIMRNCISALADYAALVAIDTRNKNKAEELRDLIGTITSYWGFDDDAGTKSTDDFMQDFDYKVDDALRGQVVDVDTFAACGDALTGLALYGSIMVNFHGSDIFALSEAIRSADLLIEIADYYGMNEEIMFAKESAVEIRNSVKTMLDKLNLLGNEVEGIENANYAIKRAILFDNDMGFAFGHNPNAASPYVSWVMNLTDKDELNFEIGKYFQTEENALYDYANRIESYTIQYDVIERPIPSQIKEEDVWRTYKAEIDMADMEHPHLEVFGADNDVDAVWQANELCNEGEGLTLLEVHELDENYDSIREIDLRFHDTDAKRFMNVDLIDFLGKIADKTILHHPQDFKLDIEKLWEQALKENPEAERFMWHCSEYGTHILPEEEVFIKDTGAYSCWCNYRPTEPSMVGYIIEVTGYDKTGDSVAGNVYDVGEYAAHAQYVAEKALSMDSVSLTYANTWGINAGRTITVPKFEYDQGRHRLMSESGDVVKIKYHASESNQTMVELLGGEKARNMAMPIGNTHEHLQSIDDKMAAVRGALEENKHEVVFAPKTEAINGEVSCYDIVIATGDSEYPYFVGEINAVHKLGTEEHTSGNSTDDVFVDFNSDEYSDDRKREIETHFSKLHGKQLRFDEDIAPNISNVRMAPEHLIEITETELAMLVASREYCETFCEGVLGKGIEIMPDPTISTAERDDYGYDQYADMLPLNHERALLLFTQGNEVFLLFNDNSEALVEELSQINEHDGIFGIERETWQKSDARAEIQQGKAENKEIQASIQQKQGEPVKQTINEPTQPKPKKPYRGDSR